MLKSPIRGLALLGLATLVAVWAGCSKGNQGPTTPAVDTTAPTVISTNPANGATGVAAITATFSEPMNISTINEATFFLTGPAAAIAAGTVSYGDMSDMATFTPAGALTPGVRYTATITTGVQDASGNSMAVNKVWTFTTSATATEPAVPPDPAGPRRD